MIRSVLILLLLTSCALGQVHIDIVDAYGIPNGFHATALADNEQGAYFLGGKLNIDATKSALLFSKDGKTWEVLREFEGYIKIIDTSDDHVVLIVDAILDNGNVKSELLIYNTSEENWRQPSIEQFANRISTACINNQNCLMVISDDRFKKGVQAFISLDTGNTWESTSVFHEYKLIETGTLLAQKDQVLLVGRRTFDQSSRQLLQYSFQKDSVISSLFRPDLGDLLKIQLIRGIPIVLFRNSDRYSTYKWVSGNELIPIHNYTSNLDSESISEYFYSEDDLYLIEFVCDVEYFSSCSHYLNKIDPEGHCTRQFISDDLLPYNLNSSMFHQFNNNQLITVNFSSL